MKRLLLFLAALLMGVSVWAQNNPPADVTATAMSNTKVKIAWNTPAGTTQPMRLNLFDQADMVTHHGVGHNGADVSACYGGQNTLGRNANASSKFWMADDFTLTGAALVREIEFYAYQTGSSSTSSFTACYVQIFDSEPIDSTAEPIWSSDSINCMTSTSWTGIYRTTATAFTDTTRPIMRVVAGINATLPAGNYWVAVCLSGSLASGPWGVPRAVLGEVSTGNAIQYLPSEGMWGPWEDGTSYEQMGLPLIVRGEFVSDNLRGFNVYKNNNQINTALIEGFSYIDANLEEETEYCYSVEAVYTSGATAMSDAVCATTLYNPCRITSMPYSESFDTYGTGYSAYPNVAYPTCWSKYNGANTTSTVTLSYPYITTTNHSAPGSLYMYAGTNYYTMAITPLIDSNNIDINTLRASMRLKNSATTATTIYRLIVGTIVDPSDPNTFEPYDTLVVPANTNFELYKVDFNQYTGNAHYIALRSGSGSATNSVYVDDFVLDYIPSCDVPSDLTVSSFTSNSITLWWTPTTPAPSWEVEYRMANEEDWIQESGISTTSFTIDNLEPNTSYTFTFKVKALCAPDDESAWLSESFTVSTSCEPVTEFPYTESFDSYGTGTSAYPNCWSKSHTQTTTSVSYPYINTTYVSAPGAMYFYSTTSYGVWAVTPYFDANISMLQADFKLRKAGANYQLAVGVISNPDDLSTFVGIDTLSPSATSTWENFSVTFDAYTGSGHYIAFVSNFGATNGMYMDNLVIGEIQTCFAPTTISLESATTSSASVVWNSTDEMASYDLRYRLVGEDDWTTVPSISDTTYLLENLDASSRYELQIQTICTDAVSYWSEIFIFQTLCDAVTELPYFEGFEDYGYSTAGSEYPICWTRSISYSTSTTTAPFCNTTQHHEGAASLRIQGGACATTPEFDEDIHNLQVSFWLRSSNITTVGDMQIGVMSNPNDINTFEMVATIRPEAASTWYYYEINLNNTLLTGTGNYIAFRQVNSSSNTVYYWLDDVDVHIIPTCINPYNLFSSDPTQNSAVLHWSDDNAVGNYELQYKSAQDTEWTVISGINDTLYLLENLTPSTIYNVQVRAICTGNDYSRWSDMYNFSTLCGEVSNLPYFEGFEFYGSGTAGSFYPTCWTRPVSYVSGTTTAPFCNSAQYHSGSVSLRFQGKAWAATPQIGEDIHSLQVSFWLRKEGASSGDFQVGVMSDPTDTTTFELVETLPVAANATWYQYDINFDNTQLTGAGNYIAFRQANTTSNVYYYWLDDVEVNIIPTCLRPSNVNVTSIGVETATVSWSANGHESEWQLGYMAEGDVDWIEITGITDSTYQLTSLEAGTTYQVRVKAVCDDGNESGYGIGDDFTTLCTPLDTLPYIESFDSYASGAANFPECWIRKTNSTTSYPYIYSSYYASPSRSLYFYASTTTYCYAALPALPEDVDMQEVQVSFKARKTSAAYKLEVGVMTDPFDLSTYTVVQTISPTTTTTSEDFTVYMNSYTGPGKFIVFKTPEGLSTYMYLDDIEIDYAPECLLPTNVNVTNIASTEATVNWGSAPDESEWQIVYGPTGFSMDEVEPISIDVNPYTLTGLEPNTSYDVYLRTICSNGEISAYSPVTTFTTACAPLTLPYSESFDSYGTGTTAYPDCWRKINNNTNFPYIYAMTSSTGLTVPGALYFSTTSTTYAYAILPEFDAELNTLQMSFAFKAAMGNGYFLEVGVLEDLSDTSSFVLIQTIEPRTAVWNSFTVAFTGYEGAGKYIAIRSQRAGASNVCYIDNLVVDYAPGCVAPMHLEAENLTTTSADLTWRPGRDESSWIVAYGPKNFNPNVTGVSQNTMAYPFTISGLEPGTFYDFYVKAECDAEETSEWSMKGSFRTDCLLIDTLPYTESFDTYGTGITAFPNCWNRNTTNSATTQYPYINTTYNSEPGALYFYSTSTTYNYVTLPEVDETLNLSLLRLSFKLRKSSAAYHLKVGVMTDPYNKNTFVEVARVSPSAINTWQDFEVEFFNYMGTGHYIAFASDTAAANYMYLDDVVLDFAPTCHEVSNIRVSGITTDQATISWTPITEGVSWDVEYGPAGFEQGSTAGTTLTSQDTFLVLNNLTNGTLYDVYVRQICAGNDESPWSDRVSFSTDCTPLSLPYTENFDNPSYNATTYNIAGDAPVCWTTITNNTSYPAPHIVGSGTSYYYYNSASNSLVFTAGSAGSDAYAVLPEFTSPLNTLKLYFWRAMESATLGTLSVGYVTDRNNIAATFTSVATITSIVHSGTGGGGVDSVDFSALSNIPATGYIAFHWNYGSSYYSCCIDDINVTTNSVPVVDPTVTTNQASAIAQTTATLNGVVNNPSNVTITARGFEWKAGSASDYTVVTLTGTSNTLTHNLTNLTANTAYTYKAFITFNGNTVYGEDVNFTTLEEGQETCDAPTNLTATATAYNIANVTWTAGGTETAWNLRYKSSTTDWTTVPVTATSYQLTGLTAQTTYEVQVQAVCSSTSSSEWTASVSFTTPAEPVDPCDAPTGFTVNDVTTTTATISWTAVGSANTWKVQYRQQGTTQWQEATVQTPSYDMEGLTPNTTYEVQVKAICAAGNESDPLTGTVTTQTVGIDNITLANSINLMPNPADNYIDLTINSNVEVKEAVVYNAFGQKIQTVELTDNHARIDLSDMAAGMYFVRVNSDNVSATKKFIKR